MLTHAPSPVSLSLLPLSGFLSKKKKKKLHATRNRQRYTLDLALAPVCLPPLSDEDLQPPTSPSCPESILIAEEYVATALLKLDVSKSTGIDSVSARMLKSTALSIAPSLTKLFNLSIIAGCPDDWKVARIVPIPKADDMSSPVNYRPISILPIVSKVLERHISSIIMDYLEDVSPISANQWGFMPGRSTTSALLSITNSCQQALDVGYDVCTVFFDIRNAFDSVPHQLLLEKMKRIGLNEYLLHWLHTYLSNRKQVVVVDGESSEELSVLSGVPQGSVLGPLLFLVYINEVSNQASDGSNIVLFADDIALYRVITSTNNYAQLQSDIDSIADWVEESRLSLHSGKCCAMLFSRKRTLSHRPLMLKGNQLKFVDQYKYLGLIFCSNLCWSEHINSICNKARRLIGLLYRRFYEFSDSQSLLKLYCSFIRPHMEYSSIVWSPYLLKQKAAIEKVQHFALRVCLKDWSLGYDKALDLTRLPSLETRRDHASLCFLYNIVHQNMDFESAPVASRTISRFTRYSNSHQLQQPYCRTTWFQNSFFPRVISMWNSLPEEVLATHSSFKHAIMH